MKILNTSTAVGSINLGSMMISALGVAWYTDRSFLQMYCCVNVLCTVWLTIDVAGVNIQQQKVINM